jgi:hypothetical protein
LTETNIGLGGKAGRRFTKPIPPPKQEGVAILISEKETSNLCGSNKIKKDTSH